jgi:hypothetical protein
LRQRRVKIDPAKSRKRTRKKANNHPIRNQQSDQKEINSGRSRQINATGRLWHFKGLDEESSLLKVIGRVAGVEKSFILAPLTETIH